MDESWMHDVVISPVKNGYVIHKGNTAYIAFTYNELNQLIKFLLEKEDLPDIPF